MPNWCQNGAVFMHDDREMHNEVAKAFENGELFQHFVPVSEDGNCSDAWGTKWDAHGGEIVDLSEDGVTLIFETAWGPPIEFYRKMEELGFSVEASFVEWGMEFVGKYEDGVLEEYKFDDDIPEDLDETWQIRETLAMWDEENDNDN